MKITRAIIFHGTQGSPAGNWFQWLEIELKARGLETWLPKLPNAEQPSLKQWAEYIESNKPFELDDNTLLIGHSSGAILEVILAQRSTVKIGAVVGVSIFLNNALKWEPNDKLFDVDFDFQVAKSNINSKLIIQSDDDPYVPVEQAKFIADSIGAEFLLIPGQGHFNLEKSETYKQFPKLVEILEERKIL